MKTSRFCISIFALGMILGVPFAQAQDYRVGSLRIDQPWATATPQGAKVGAGYMKIMNEGSQTDRLIAITSPVAPKVAVHASVKEGDIVKMRLLDKALEIKPGETVELSPEGTHVMFEGLSGPLVAGTRAKATLTFEKAGSIEVEYTVEPLGTKARKPSARTHNH